MDRQRQRQIPASTEDLTTSGIVTCQVCGSRHVAARWRPLDGLDEPADVRACPRCGALKLQRWWL